MFDLSLFRYRISFKGYESLTIATQKIVVSMNYLASLVLPACLGLFTGVGHGIYSHQQDLPFSLTEQIIQVMPINSTLED